MNAMTPFMTPERWHAIEPILDRALELSAEDRAAFLDRECGSDSGLRYEVEAFLAADSDAGTFLEGSPASLIARQGDAGPLPIDVLAPGTDIGPYRVVRLLGQGGMGTVYLGERADGQFEQTVALKLIRRGSASSAVHRRFLAERQILARLQHPNIARLVDGGLTASGQPWLAMEYVAGEPFLAWCDAHRMSIADRLALFEQVAEAVRYAHQNLVVHRDLKPTNILVAPDGRSKLLDFGIAKVLSPALDSAPVSGGDAATDTGLLMLTPEYAAPEQMRGEPVTTATDVYALGAVLYELLTGQRVHRFDKRTAAELERVICEVDPDPPSTAATLERSVAEARDATPSALRQMLKGDLDTIVLTALRKMPAQRYQTVDSLLGDLRNYRDGLPIHARPASAAYRIGKFIRRHRFGVTAGAALVVALGAGVVATLWQARATAREAARAEAVKEFLVDLFQTADPAEARGRDISARELLARGVKRVDSALVGQPLIQEELLSDLGRIHRDLGLYETADTLARRAADLASRLFGGESPQFAARLTEWGAASRMAGHAPRSDTLLRRALDLRKRALGGRHPDVATTISELARTAADRGAITEANTLARQAMEIDRAFYGPRDLRVARDLELLANLHAEIEGEYGAADSAYRAALLGFSARYDASHPEVIRVQNAMAANLRNMRRYPEAEAIHRDVLAKYRALYPTGHPDVAAALHDLGVVLGRQRRFVEAESSYAASLDIRRRLVGYDIGTVSILNDLGVLRAESGDLPGAERALREAVDSSRVALGASHPSTMSALGNLAVVLTRQKKLVEAEAVLREVIVQRRSLRSERPGLARALTSLGAVLRDGKRYREAEASYREAESIARENEARKSLLAAALSGMGVMYLRQNRLRDAETSLHEAVTLRRGYLDAAAPARLADEKLLADVLIRLGRSDEAKQYVRR